MNRPGPLQTARRAGPAIEADEWWSLSDTGLELVLGEIVAGRRQVLECGSGASTVLIARTLRALGRGRVWALEHDPAWAMLTRRRITAEDLDACATVIEAPLRPVPELPASAEWYDRTALDRLPESGFDLLLVDGPPAGSPPIDRARYPALPLLRDRLADGAIVVLDDAHRPGERWVLERWEHELAIGFDECGEGLAVGTVAFEPVLHSKQERIE